MRQGTACDFGPPGAPLADVDWPLAKPKLEHQEERVRNRYRRFNICIALALASALPALTQSSRIEALPGNELQLTGDPAQSLLTAKLVEAPAIGNGSDETNLPDAP